MLLPVSALIVTVDTEEEGLWSGAFPTAGATVTNIAGVPRFQDICDRLQIQPTYLVNSPVAENETAVAILKEILDSHRCEIGTHIHPWNTAPIVGNYNARDSYLCNLPTELQNKKLLHVTRQIEDNFERRPLSFRSGRYGLDADGAALLRQMGYIVDSSVCPFTDYSADGGPDFRGAPVTPYRIGEDIRGSAGSGCGLLEVPVSIGFNRTNFARCDRFHQRISRGIPKKFRAVGLLDRLGVLQKTKFSPEKGGAGRLMALARAYAKQNLPCLVLMFHSSSLLPGATPYVPDQKSLAGFLDDLATVLEYCVALLSLTPMTLTQFAQRYEQEECC